MARVANPNWRPARVIENREIARGSWWLTLEAADEAPAAYEPGHVLGLGLKQTDGSWLRHAYTVSQGDPARKRFSHLYRHILGGRMTPVLKGLRPGAAVYFHGPGHNPIQREIDPAAGRIAGIATGTGIGPLYGYALKALADGERRPIALYAGFRERADLCLGTELTAMARQHPNLSHAFTLTQPDAQWTGLRGRVDEALPSLLGELSDTHFHLVGNGEMVHLWRKALLRAGVPERRVTIETYFNHSEDPTAAAVDELAARLLAS